MKFPLHSLRLFLPLAPVFALIPLITVPSAEEAPTPSSRTADLNPHSPGARTNIPEQVRWERYLDQNPGLSSRRKALRKLSERLPLAKFEKLSPQLQKRLAAYAESRLDPANPRLALCWEPGVPTEVMEAFHAAEELTAAATEDTESDPLFAAATQFNENDRWGTNANFSEAPEQGLPTILTWNVVPDGTFIAGFNGEPDAPSDLIAFLDTAYGVTNGNLNDITDRPWFTVIESAFANISDSTGVTYVFEPADDGSAISTNIMPFGPGPRRRQPPGSGPGSGSLGLLADVRISGHFVDGESGSNTLAYNFFPGGGGDMVIDTGNPNFFGNTSFDSLNLRNVVEHEHGHGLGLGHVCPITQTKLMEPFISRQFRGLQLDDIFSLNRLYGDFFEKHSTSRNNDSVANAAPLTLEADQSFTREMLSIDDNSDLDFYLLNNLTSGNTITARVIPVATPGGFLQGPQNTDGSCSAGSTFDFTNIHDLEIALIDSDGSTVLTLADTQAMGESEEITAFPAPATGDYYLRVTGGAANSSQLYTLEIEIAEPVTSPYADWVSAEQLDPAEASPNQDPDGDGFVNFQEFFFDLDPNASDATAIVDASVSPDGTTSIFSFSKNPDSSIADLIFEISSDLTNWNLITPTPSELTITPQSDLEEVILSIPSTDQNLFLRLGLTLPE